MTTPPPEPPGNAVPPGNPTYPGAPHFPSPGYPGNPHANHPSPGFTNPNFLSGPGYSPAPADPLVPVDLGGWLNLTFEITKRSFWRIAKIWLVYIAALLLPVGGGLTVAAWMITLASGQRTVDPVTATTVIAIFVFVILFTWVTAAWAQAASVHLAVTDAVGWRVPVAQALRLTSSRVGALFGWSVLGGLLITLGALLIVPGIYLAVVLGATLTGVAMIERAGIGRCFALIKNRFWPTFGRLALGYLLIMAYQTVAQFLFIIVLVPLVPLAAIGNTLDAPVLIALAAVSGLLLLLVTVVVTLPIMVYVVALHVVTYAELRNHEQPGTSAATLAAELVRG